MNFIIKDADEGKVLRNSHSFNSNETSSIIYFSNVLFYKFSLLVPIIAYIMIHSISSRYNIYHIIDRGKFWTRDLSNNGKSFIDMMFFLPSSIRKPIKFPNYWISPSLTVFYDSIEVFNLKTEVNPGCVEPFRTVTCHILVLF